MTATVEIRRAADRAVTTTSWLKSRHSFSFGDHYDPDNTHHGLLLVNNDDQMEPASGFDPHPHRDMEIVTWVLRGAPLTSRVCTAARLSGIRNSMPGRSRGGSLRGFPPGSGIAADARARLQPMPGEQPTHE